MLGALLCDECALLGKYMHTLFTRGLIHYLKQNNILDLPTCIEAVSTLTGQPGCARELAKEI